MTGTVPSSHASPDITTHATRVVVVDGVVSHTDAAHGDQAVRHRNGGGVGGRRRIEQFFLHPQHSLVLPDGEISGVGGAEAALVYDLYVSPSPDDGDAIAPPTPPTPQEPVPVATATAARTRTLVQHKTGNTKAGMTVCAGSKTSNASLAEPFAGDEALDGVAVNASVDDATMAAVGNADTDHACSCHAAACRGDAACCAKSAVARTTAAAAAMRAQAPHPHPPGDDDDDDGHHHHRHGDRNYSGEVPRNRARETADDDVSRHSAAGSDGSGGQDAANSSSGGSRGGGERRKALSTLLLTGLMYSLTTGGAYGIEESVLGGGALLTIVFLLIIPLIMGLPIAVVVAELTCAVPSDAGFLMWINLAFHRSVYLTMAVLSVFYTVVDNALYPVMFSDYCCTVLTCSRVQTAALRVGMVVFVYALNMVGVGVVGVASVVLTTLTVLPFVLLLVTQQATMRGYVNWPAIAFVPAVIDWTTFITTASWNLSGLEQAAAVVEEVRQPQRTLMRAFIPLLVLVLLTYIPAVIAGASVTRGPMNLDEWQTGFWAIAAFRVGGRVLQVVMVLGSILSAFGMTLSTLCTTTRLIAGMATTEVFPGKVGKWLSRRNARFDTHHYTLTLNALVTAVVSVALEFDALVQVDQCLYGIRVVLILIAFFELRRRYPHLRRPFRVPLQGVWLYVAFALPFASFCVLTVISLVSSKLVVALCAGIVGGTALVCGLICIFIRKVDYLGRIVTVTYEHSD